ncbi:MAG: GNAT family N-acetyltransferase [Gammaproteobacteria bacterium]
MARYLNTVGNDPYIAGLPIAPNAALAGRYVGGSDSAAFVARDHDNPVGCIMGRLAESSFPPAGLTLVGCIDVCYVESEYRKSGVAAGLTEAIETWFREKGIGIVELSYLAKNRLAATAWKHLGYEPFRVFAYKQL